MVACLVGEHVFYSTGSVVMADAFICSVACGIFPDQRSNWCPLHCKADLQPPEKFPPLHCKQSTSIVREDTHFLSDGGSDSVTV